MAFWIDPFLLAASGVGVALVAKRVDARFVVSTACGLVLAVFYGVSVGLFVDFSALAPLVRLLGAETGTEFMINGWILDLVPPGTHWSDLSDGAMFGSILAFVTYPLWLALGVVLGRIAVGRNPDQGGVLGLLWPGSD